RARCGHAELLQARRSPVALGLSLEGRPQGPGRPERARHGGRIGQREGLPAPVASEVVEELVAVLRARQDELVEEGVRRIRTEIAAYARVEDPAFVEDVRRHVAAHHEQLVRSLARGRPLERDEMTFMRPTVSRRVGRIPLTAFMRGFRTYLEVI